MERIKNILGFSQEYINETQQYKTIDFYLSLFLYFVMLSLYFLMGKIFASAGTALSEPFIFITTGIVSALLVGIVFLICHLRKQGISSIGFGKAMAKRSLRCGMILLVSVIAIFGGIATLTGSSIRNDAALVSMRFLYFLFFIAFVEELIFRGYIGTRLYGCFKNKVLAVIVTGILFSLMHIPCQMMMTNRTLLEYISTAWPNLISVFVLHFTFQFLYAKNNSMIAPTVFHFVWDYVQWIII